MAVFKGLQGCRAVWDSELASHCLLKLVPGTAGASTGLGARQTRFGILTPSLYRLHDLGQVA